MSYRRMLRLPEGARILRVNESKRLDLVFAGLPSKAMFQVSEQIIGPLVAGVKLSVFRDPAAVSLLRGVSVALCENGCQPKTNPHPGKGCDAAFTCQLPRGVACIVFLLSMERLGNGNVRCSLTTFPSRGLLGRLFWRYGHVGESFPEEWRRICSVIERYLSNELKASGFRWESMIETRDRLMRDRHWS